MKENITIGLASFPPRQNCLKVAIDSVIHQCDKINIYLNNYKEIPVFLNNKKINCFLQNDIGDIGKFFNIENERGYYFTIDDDIIYPKDYVTNMINSLNKFKNKVAIGVHGYTFNKPIRNIYKDRALTHYRSSLVNYRNVHVIGTGTLAFHTSTLQLKLNDFLKPNMADIWFALSAQRNKIPLYLLPRPNKWLMDIPEALVMESIYNKSKNKSHGNYQTEVVNQYKEWKLYE